MKQSDKALLEKVARIEAMSAIGARWDGLTVPQRAALIRRDPSMRDRRWNDLVGRMANSQFAALPALQQEAVEELFKTYGAGW